MTTWVPIGNEDPYPTGIFNTGDGSVVAQTPGKLDIKLVKGVPNSFDIKFELDLTGYTFAAPIVDEYTGVTIVPFTVTNITGGIKLSVTAAQVTTLLNYTKLKWDLDATKSSVPVTWMTGKVEIIETGN